MPIAMVMIPAACTSRLRKLPAVRKLEFWDWKTTAMISSPMTIGSEPRSPPRTPTHQRAA
jgi:hypothetical protein